MIHFRAWLGIGCVDGYRQCKENPASLQQRQSMFNPSRDEARNFLFESWRKRRANELLTPLEDLTAQLIDKHPEFHAVLEDPERYQDKDYQPEHGTTNPFLHLMMHLTIEEQISI